ncbi:alpha-mannosidase [Spirulina subsalsa FACHB-351]|uniref:Alpha-mannosidase n=1 Tax=Spirulina subsalsa FACHB-351 TaxID=234711 RepID=A0ABT3LAL5_9CYAN|nr:alpha-mannosidase [Spirulina subsalsa]MCW6038172.1 alpha-mannosidase [Spirulina subsalsa FACHB-351]
MSIIAQLKELTEQDIKGSWRNYQGEDSPFHLTAEEWEGLPIASLNDKGYIVWEAGHQVQWLGQTIVIPSALNGYPLDGLELRLCLTWWSENAQVFVNGQLVQEGDLFDSSARVLLTSQAQVGDSFLVCLRLVSPGHDIGGLMRSLCVYENPQGIDPGFVAHELEILQNYWQRFTPERMEKWQEAVGLIDWHKVGNQGAFHGQLEGVRNALKVYSVEMKERCFYVMGHAHLDMAWLWELGETYEVARRTFSSVLRLQEEFPELTFCHTSPILYEWMEKHHPELFTAIQEAVRGGRWDVLGGMWVEPDVNLVSGESILRQLLYGQEYIKSRFGEITKVAWLTDSFGFNGQLPQLLNAGGIEYFVTQKLHWNDSTEFPYGAFWWESPDGTRVFTLMSPPNVTGVMDTHPITMTNYGVKWEAQTGLKAVFWLPGVGDHGGGPTRDMLAVQKRWQGSPFFPRIRFTKAADYLGLIRDLLGIPPNPPLEGGERGSIPPLEGGERGSIPPLEGGERGCISPLEGGERGSIPPLEGEKIEEGGTIPVWKDELYLEFHRGCYTTHGEQKWFNRRCEGLLYQGELLASLASLLVGVDFPRKELEGAWKEVLLNQFHDILPGTSIPEVFAEANLGWKRAIASTEKMITSSLSYLTAHLSFPPPPQPGAKPFVVFNGLNWRRSQIIPLSCDTGQVLDSQGQILPCQPVNPHTLLFDASDVPGVGYRVFWWVEEAREESPHSPISPPGVATENYCLENPWLNVQISSTTGDICQVFHKIQQQEILRGAGNQLQFFRDEGQYWDAWNIDPNYEQYPLPGAELKAIEWIENGPVRWRLRVIRQFNQSQFTQDYILEATSPILHIETTVDWQERHVLVKAAFPLNLEANFASYEMACGTIERTTKPSTPQEKAKWEVPALNWADLSDNQGEWGVSLLNNGKYGYDAKPDCLRLTLLRSPQWPHRDADRKIHHFTYSLYPHQGQWQEAKTVHRGYELNLPLLVSPLLSSTSCSSTSPESQTFFTLGGDNLVLMAFKPTETEGDGYIARFYEAYGQETTTPCHNTLNLIPTHGVNALEVPQGELENGVLRVHPWQIVSVKLVGDSKMNL